MQRRVASNLVFPMLAAAIVAGVPGAARSSMPTPAYSTAAAPRCSHLGRYVSVGGTAGFNVLADAGDSTALRATGHARLYEHANAVAAAITGSPISSPYSILNSIENVFRGSGPGEAELGLVGSNYFTLPAGNYPGYYQYQFVNSGLTPNEANVNVPYEPVSAITYDRQNVEAWEAWVQAAQSVGIASMAPVVAPNIAWEPDNPIFPPTPAEYYDLNSSFYDLSRFEALYGRAIALDTPSDFFLAGGSGRGYQGFIEQAIRWGNAHGLRTTVLVSALNQDTFTEDTKKFVGVLLAHDAIPSEWSVDDYEDTNPNDANAIGPDTRKNTTTEVALWLALHAPVYVRTYLHGRVAGGMVCRLPESPLR